MSSAGDYLKKIQDMQTTFDNAAKSEPVVEAASEPIDDLAAENAELQAKLARAEEALVKVNNESAEKIHAAKVEAAKAAKLYVDLKHKRTGEVTEDDFTLLRNAQVVDNVASVVSASDDAPATEAPKAITVVNGDEFMAEKIPPRKVLVRTITSFEPVIFEQSINQVFAWRGIGKTCLGLGFVRALATAGEFLNFKADERVHVLYVEGELPDSQMQERWKAIVGKTDGYAHLATIDKQPGHSFESLATKTGMEKIESSLTELQERGIDVKVLMLDNISTLFNISANEEEAWIDIQRWFTSLRSRGLTIFFFHHAGKGGKSRSHSKSEDMLDLSIKLEIPDDQETGHLHAVLEYDKARAGLSEKPAEIKLRRTHSEECSCLGLAGPFCQGDGVKWEYIPMKNLKAEAFAFFAAGKSVNQVAELLNAKVGTIKDWRAQYSKAVMKGEKATG